MPTDQSLFSNTPQAITLSALNNRIADAVNADPGLHRQWVTAETSDVRVSRGHCYLELIEKDDKEQTVARLGAVIWASTYAGLAARFKDVTGQDFASGMKVMVCMTVNFHGQYGIKAVIGDINPEFTLGDMARLRKEIIDKLTKEGIIDNNKRLPWATVPQRVAVISSATAAGYGDFMNQLDNNAYGLKFYTHLFTAVLQGNNTVPSVLEALKKVASLHEHFDCLVIIRGGGATSELNSFDNYDLARAVALFPIPVIVGIGHERDTTVLDYVAAMRVKTPTAAAEFLIGQGINALARLDELRNLVINNARDILGREREHISYYTSLIPATAQRIVSTAHTRLDNYLETIPMAATSIIKAQNTRLDHSVEIIKSAVTQSLATAQLRLQSLDDKVTLLSPRNILNRGYSLTMRGGKFVTEASQLNPGDVITTFFKDGKATTQVGAIKLDKQ